METITGIQEKVVEPTLVASIEGEGQISEANKDIDRLYEYIYSNNLQDKITGPTIALFYTEQGGKYSVAVPLKERIPESESVKVTELPEVKVLSLMHTDLEQDLDISFNKIKEFENQRGLKWQFPVREIYFPLENQHGKYNTEIQVPIG